MEWLIPELDPISPTNHAIKGETKVLATVGFFRSGGFQWLMGSANGPSQSSISRILEKVTNIIVRTAKEQICLDSDMDSLLAKKRKYGIAQTPNIIGIIDGSQVQISFFTPFTRATLSVSERFLALPIK